MVGGGSGLVCGWQGVLLLTGRSMHGSGLCCAVRGVWVGGVWVWDVETPRLVWAGRLWGGLPYVTAFALVNCFVTVGTVAVVGARVG